VTNNREKGAKDTMSYSSAVLDLSPDLKSRLREHQYPRADQFSEEEIVVLASFLDGPKDLNRLLEDEYPDAFSRGLLGRDQVKNTLKQLQSKGLVVAEPDSNGTGNGFSDEQSRDLQAALQSIARLTSRIAGNAAGLSAGAGARASIEQMSIQHRLDQVRAALAAIYEELTNVRAEHVRCQLDALGITEQTQHLRINIGSGPRRLPKPWINIDLLSDADLSMNVQWGLPFADGSVDYIYGAHFFEHIDYKVGAQNLLGDFWRVLSPGGKVRLVVPNIHGYMSAYIAGSNAFFEERCRSNPFAKAFVKTNLEHVLDYAGVGTRSRAGEFFEHKFGYDFDVLQTMLKEAGFAKVTHSAYMSSADPVLRIDNAGTFSSIAFDGIPNSLFIDAVK
jgi:predicted SAM-dependent methyltransferase